MATLSLSPSADNFSVDSEFEVAVILDTGGQAINVIDIIIYFPEDLIEASEFPSRDGLLPLWQFNASNEKGEISIVGGERQEGVIASNSEITRIKFKVKKEGKAILKISSKNSSIIAADGFGTKIPIKAGEAYYSLTSSPVVVKTPKISETKISELSAEPQKKELKAIILISGEIKNILPFIQVNFVNLLVMLAAVIYNAQKNKIVSRQNVKTSL